MMVMNKMKGNMYSFIDYTWNPIRGKCPHDCGYCLPAETMILMDDFTHKPICDVKKGDMVLGLEMTDGFKKFRKSEVLNLSKHRAKTIIIKTDKGTLECTPEHKLYGSSDKRNCVDWRQAKIFSPYDLIRFLGIPKSETPMHKLGWIIGFIDGDGCFFKHYNKERREYWGFEAVCVDDKLRKSFIDYCAIFGILLKEGTKVSSKKSYNPRSKNPLIFSRVQADVKKLKYLYEEHIKEFSLPFTKFDGCIRDFFEGYIGGLLDTDGSVSKTNQVRISQSKTANLDVYKRLIRALQLLNIQYTEEDAGILLKGGFPMRSQLLFCCKPKHSIKSKNLIHNFSVKGTYKAEVTNIQMGKISDVYNIATTTENYIANGFIVHNCYMKSFWKIQKSEKQILDEKCLKDNLGEGNFIFVGSSTDMFAESVPIKWINRVLNYCAKFKLNKYLFQSKNPKRMNQFVFPDNSTIGTTIETNRDNSISKSPHCSERLFYIKTNPNPRMITIEPIMDFDLDIMVGWIKDISPKWVNIGADSKGHNLPEPSKEKVEALIKELKKFTIVKLKDNLKRITQ